MLGCGRGTVALALTSIRASVFRTVANLFEPRRRFLHNMHIGDDCSRPTITNPLIRFHSLPSGPLLASGMQSEQIPAIG